MQDVPYDSPREGGYGHGGIHGIGAEPPPEMLCVFLVWQDFGAEHEEEEEPLRAEMLCVFLSDGGLQGNLQNP